MHIEKFIWSSRSADSIMLMHSLLHRHGLEIPRV